MLSESPYLDRTALGVGFRQVEKVLDETSSLYSTLSTSIAIPCVGFGALQDSDAGLARVAAGDVRTRYMTKRVKYIQEDILPNDHSALRSPEHVLGKEILVN